MSRDPLQALLRFRQTAVDEAQKEVGHAYRAEREAIEIARAANEALELEMREASSLTAGDETVEAFARWLPSGRRKVAEAHERQRQATAELDQVRTVLMLASAAVKAVETLMQQKKEKREEQGRRREQAVLDEFASRGDKNL